MAGYDSRFPAFAENVGVRHISGALLWSPGTEFQGIISASFPLSAGRVYMLPFTAYTRITIDNLAVNTATSSLGDVAKVGIWEMLENGRPGIVLHTPSSEQSLALSGFPQASNIEAVIDPGSYWFGFATDSSAGQLSSVSKADVRRIGNTTFANSVTYWRFNPGWVSGDALPDYPTGETAKTSDPPLVLVRIK